MFSRIKKTNAELGWRGHFRQFGCTMFYESAASKGAEISTRQISNFAVHTKKRRLDPVIENALSCLLNLPHHLSAPIESKYQGEQTTTALIDQQRNRFKTAKNLSEE